MKDREKPSLRCKAWKVFIPHISREMHAKRNILQLKIAEDMIFPLPAGNLQTHTVWQLRYASDHPSSWPDKFLRGSRVPRLRT
jgi:hypothetical protein